MRSRLAIASLVFACQPAPVASPIDGDPCGQDIQAAPDALVAFEVSPTAGDDVVLVQAYSATPPRIGTRFAVADERGFVGIVVATSAKPFRRCGGCGCSVSWPAAWQERLVKRTEGGLDAVGPFQESFRGIRRLVPEPMEGDLGSPIPAPISRPRATVRAWDLSGDGRADLEVVHEVCESESAHKFEVWESRAGKRVLTSRDVLR